MRSFGVEIEAKGLTPQQAASVMCEAGIHTEFMGYTHRRTPHWKTVTDASVIGGFEAVSPPFESEAGLTEMGTVMQALSAAGATVGLGCGFHVHFDADDLTAGDIGVIVQRYARFERTIDTWMPRSRINNSFCKPLTPILSRVLAYSDKLTMAYNFDRNYKINLCALRRHGTIEFRQHAGTLSPKKASEWIKFCAEFIEYSIKAPRDCFFKVQGSTKLYKLYQLLQRGTTIAKAAQELGWLEKTVRAAMTNSLRSNGIVINKERVDGVWWYQLDASAPKIDNVFSGINEETVAFLRNRSNEVSPEGVA